METEVDADYPEDDLQYDEVDDEIDRPVDDEGNFYSKSVVIFRIKANSSMVNRSKVIVIEEVYTCSCQWSRLTMPA